MKSSIYSETMDGNESITIYEASEFYDEVLDVGVYEGVGISVLVGSITMVALGGIAYLRNFHLLHQLCCSKAKTYQQYGLLRSSKSIL